MPNRWAAERLDRRIAALAHSGPASPDAEHTVSHYSTATPTTVRRAGDGIRISRGTAHIDLDGFETGNLIRAAKRLLNPT